MWSDDEITRAITERMPPPGTLRMLGKLREMGMDWEDIEARIESVSEDIESGDFPFSNEAERYTRRLLIAAHAYEVDGQNN